MSPITVQIIAIAGLLFAVFVGSRFNKNIGIISMAVAYLLCCFLMGQSPSVLIDYWPTSLTFAQIAIMYFYGFANCNGTMQVLAEKLLYPFRKIPKLLPFALFFISALLCAMGASTLAVVVLMATVAVSIVKATRLNPQLAFLAVVLGCPAGNSVPWGEAGIVLRGLIDGSYEPVQSANYSIRLSVVIFVTLTVLFTLCYFIFQGYKCDLREMKKPGSFNKKQKMTLVIILSVLALILLPAIIERLYPNQVSAYLTEHLDIRPLAFLAGAICTCLNLADEREVISKIPWSVIIMVGGVGVLIDVCTSTGIMDSLSALLVTSTIPVWLLYGAVTVIGALLSIFGNSLLVVGIMIPVAESLSSVLGTGSSFSILAAATIGAYLADASPFSTGGALMLSAFDGEEERSKLFTLTIRNCFILLIVVSLMSAVGWTKLF